MVPRLIVLETIQELQSFVQQNRLFYILGKGSNTLIKPNLEVPMIQLGGEFVRSEVRNMQVYLGAGVPVHRLMAFLHRHGLSGLEFSAGVPATIGGMLAMNFGCFGKQISEFVTSVQIVDDHGVERWLPASELGFAYRTSFLATKRWIAVGAIFAMVPEDPKKIKAQTLDYIRIRLEKQPLKEKTFGSVFKNPSGRYAAELIEACGFKGYRYRDIQVSDQHANFMVNLGRAQFDDIHYLIQKIQADVFRVFDVFLEPEVKLFV